MKKSLLFFLLFTSFTVIKAQDVMLYFGQITSGQMGYEVELWMKNTQSVSSYNFKLKSKQSSFVLISAQGGTVDKYGLSVKLDPAGEMSGGGTSDAQKIPAGDTIMTNLTIQFPSGDGNVCLRDLIFSGGINMLTSAPGADSCIIMTGLEEQLLLNAKVEAYPNPSNNGVFTLKNLDGAAYEVYDVLGNKVLEATTSSTPSNIDLSKESRGLYFVRVLREEGAQTLRLHYQ